MYCFMASFTQHLASKFVYVVAHSYSLFNFLTEMYKYITFIYSTVYEFIFSFWLLLANCYNLYANLWRHIWYMYCTCIGYVLENRMSVNDDFPYTTC